MNGTASVSIRTATGVADFRTFAGLVEDYVAWTRARYGDEAWFVERVFGHQSLPTELERLAVTYGPPNGRTLLATRDGEACGVGAYQRLPDGSCEMKRLFVPDRFKGHGIGRRLCEALVAAACDDGFALMRLDTGDRMAEAIAMYESLGFRRCAPHRDYPADLMPRLIFMERTLAKADARGSDPGMRW